MAEDTGFEPVITESKSAALGQTKLIPNNITIIKFTANHSHLLFTGCDPALCAVITYKLPITIVAAIMSIPKPETAVPLFGIVP